MTASEWGEITDGVKTVIFYEVVVFKHEGSLGRVTKEPEGEEGDFKGG